MKHTLALVSFVGLTLLGGENPILFLLLLLGAIHAVEVTQKVTLALLRDVRHAVTRILASGRKHEREVRLILRAIRGRGRQRPRTRNFHT